MNVEAKIRALNAERAKEGLPPLRLGQEEEVYRREAALAREAQLEARRKRDSMPPPPPPARSDVNMSPGMIAYQEELHQERLTKSGASHFSKHEAFKLAREIKREEALDE